MLPSGRLRRQFSNLLTRFAGAIEYWTLACLTRGEFGNPAVYVEEQWRQFQNELHELRGTLSELPTEPHQVVYEQVTKLMRLSAELREVFVTLLRHTEVTREEVELAVLKLGTLWNELRMRVALAAGTVPLAAPLPSISSEQEQHYQRILDGLFDRFVSANAS